MKEKYSVLFFLVIFSLLGCSSDQKPKESRSIIDFNFDWKFYLGDLKGVQKTTIIDNDWKPVRLPHDWSVEHPFTQENTAGATAFLPGGIGWYRKIFRVSENAKNKITTIEFDGIYSNAEVWINGHYLGKHPYGYTPITYDLTKYLKYNQDNLIAVKVDRSAYIDSRWYPGSGIYRNVKLVTKNKVHIPQWGVFVTTPEVTKNQAIVKLQTTVVNRSSKEQETTIRSSIFYEGKKIGEIENTTRIQAGDSLKKEQELMVSQPNLWDVDNPVLYKTVSSIIQDNETVDVVETPFGIRTFKFDKDEGFFLNGKSTFLKGVCLHHDGGLVGSAVPKGVWQRRLKVLKEAGCNAIRTAHNPPSEEFLDLCDQMGFLVQDEAFDEWNNPKDKRHNYGQKEVDSLTVGYTEYFTAWSERDIKSMVMRDRNHPSIIMWSIGNEIEWTYPGYETATGYWGKNKPKNLNYYWDEPRYSVDEIKENFKVAKKGKYDLAKTAKQLVHWVKEIDTTRPVTANLTIPSVSNFSGYSDALDIVGLSYRQSVYDYVHQNYPDKTFLGTENWTQYHEWKQVLDKKFISGIFVWAGINYMGESKEWPARGSASGLLDYAGFKKPSYHMFKTLWSNEPHIYITTQVLEKSPYKIDASNDKIIEKEKDWAAHKKWGWHAVNEHWNYIEGQNIVVEVYTNEPAVELFLDERSMGIKKLNDQKDHVLKWVVPYQKGTVKAIGVKSGIETTVKNAGKLQKMVVTSDTNTLVSNGYDVAHVTVQLQDEAGIPIKHKDEEIKFKIEGNVKILGVDNGGTNIIEKYQSNTIKTLNGKALLILQSNTEPSKISIKAISGTIESETIQILVE